MIERNEGHLFVLLWLSFSFPGKMEAFSRGGIQITLLTQLSWILSVFSKYLGSAQQTANSQPETCDPWHFHQPCYHNNTQRTTTQRQHKTERTPCVLPQPHTQPLKMLAVLLRPDTQPLKTLAMALPLPEAEPKMWLLSRIRANGLWYSAVCSSRWPC